jgi:hypothetical protein
VFRSWLSQREQRAAISSVVFGTQLSACEFGLRRIPEM